MSVIAIVGGGPGTGKTRQAFTFPQPILSFDMENRQYVLLNGLDGERRPEFAGLHVTVVPCLKLDKDMYVDAVATLDVLRKRIGDLKSAGRVDAATIVIEGVSELRAYAIDEWVQHKIKQGKKRVQPDNPGDWGEVNDIVRQLLFPLINFCRLTGTNLVLTCGIKDQYENDIVIGEELAIKDWVAYYVDFIYWLKASQQNEYLVECRKSPYGRKTGVVTDKSVYGFPNAPLPAYEAHSASPAQSLTTGV